MRYSISTFQRNLRTWITIVSFGAKEFGWCILIVGIIFSGSARADDEVNGKVTAVLDGNTLEISCLNDEVRKVLLAEIDSPELGQEFGEEAKTFLTKLILKKDVTIQFKGKNRFGDYLAVVKINGKIDPRIELLKNGLAWTSEKDPSAELEQYRIKAQRRRIGLWKQDNAIPPWTYRRQQTMLEPKSSS